LTTHEIPHSFIAAGLEYNPKANFFVCSIQTLVKKINSKSVEPPDLVIIDEAHHCVSTSYQSLFDYLQDIWRLLGYSNAVGTRILGLTATPKRLDKRPLKPFFDVLLQGPSVRALIDSGWLCAPEVYVPPKSVAAIESMRDNWHTSMGDYNHKDLEKDLTTNKLIYGDAISHWRSLADNQPTIVFCHSVNHCRQAASEFEENGIPSEAIDGTMDDDERKTILRRLKDGIIKCVMSCDLISEGFDLPSVGCAVLLRPTQSLSIYLQQVGRVMRPLTGKSKCTIIDHVNNTALHGLPWLNRYWSLDSYGAPSLTTSNGVSLKLCGRCGNYVQSSYRTCPECKYEFIQTAKERKATLVVPTKLVKITPGMALAREKYKMLRTKEDFVQHATEKGYSDPQGWADKAFAQKEADDRVFFNGNEAELVALYSKRKNPDPAKKAKETLAKRTELRSGEAATSQHNVFASGTFEEILQYATEKKKNNPEQYAKAVLRKRLSAVFTSGTRDQVIEAAKMLRVERPEPYADKVIAERGNPQSTGVPSTNRVVSAQGQPDRSFENMLKFGQSKGIADPEKFAQNVVLKDHKAVLDSGTKEQILAVLVKAHVANPEGFANSVLARRTVAV
jgi:superfamily II DNA or RNA helicase